MHQSKLIKAIKTLNPWELRHFQDFIHSPYYNKHERVRNLVDQIVVSAPSYDTPILERKQMYGLLFDGKEFHEQKFKDLLSLTTKLFRQFLAVNQLKNNTFRTGMALLEAYRQKHLDQEYLKQRKALLKSVGSEVQKLPTLYQRDLDLQEDLITYLSGTMSRSLDDSVQLASNKLDLFFIISRLKYGVEMANRRNVVGLEYESGLLDHVLRYLEETPDLMDQNPGIKIYLSIYKCLTLTDPDPSFQELLYTLKEHGPGFSRPELREMYGYAANFCIKQINTGRSEFLPILIDLYRWALDHGALFSVDGWLIQWDYKNVVSASLKAGEAEWCRNFIETYREKIAPEFRENAYTYNLASFYFEQGDFRKALQLLQTVEFSDVFYALGSRVILLKSYYEMGDYDALNSLCESFKIYLKRNKQLSKYQFSIYFNLVSFTKKVSDLKRKVFMLQATDKHKKIEALLSKMKDKGNIAQIKWLKQKLQQMV